jgi:hypothetical protein
MSELSPKFILEKLRPMLVSEAYEVVGVWEFRVKELDKLIKIKIIRDQDNRYGAKLNYKHPFYNNELKWLSTPQEAILEVMRAFLDNDDTFASGILEKEDEF